MLSILKVQSKARSAPAPRSNGYLVSQAKTKQKLSSCWWKTITCFCTSMRSCSLWQLYQRIRLWWRQNKAIRRRWPRLGADFLSWLKLGWIRQTWATPPLMSKVIQKASFQEVDWTWPSIKEKNLRECIQRLATTQGKALVEIPRSSTKPMMNIRS